jgi:hypothetical protein
MWTKPGAQWQWQFDHPVLTEDAKLFVRPFRGH